MKKLISRILAFVLALSLLGCGKVPAPEVIPTEPAQTEAPQITEAPTQAAETVPSTGFRLFETVFLPIARGEVDPDINVISARLDRLGYEWPMFGGIITIQDPERPGSWLDIAFGDGGALSYIKYIDFAQRGVLALFTSGAVRYYTHVNEAANDGWLGDAVEVAAPDDLTGYLVNGEDPAPTVGFTLFETVFLPFARGEIGPYEASFCGALGERGLSWTIGEGILTVTDRENPGSCLSASFSTDGSASATLLYTYMLDAHRYDITKDLKRLARVEVRDGQYRFYIGGTFWDDGSQVETVQEMIDYMMVEGFRPDETPQGDYMAKMAAVLRGEEDFLSNDLANPEYGCMNMTIDEYCAAFSAPTAVTKIAAADMDGDGFDEMLLWLQVNGAVDHGTLVLHYTDRAVYGQCFVYRQMFEIKTDGTFAVSGGGTSGTGRLDIGEYDPFAPCLWEVIPVATEADQDAKEGVKWVDFENWQELFR